MNEEQNPEKEEICGSDLNTENDNWKLIIEG